MYPANGISLPITILLSEMDSPCCRHLVRTALIRWCKVWRSGADTKMSSTSLTTPSSPLMHSSDLRHHSSLEELSPMGLRTYLNLPWGSSIVVSFEEASSKAIWWYEDVPSRRQKYLALGSMEETKSSTHGKGWIGLWTYLFKGPKSVTNLSPLP